MLGKAMYEGILVELPLAAFFLSKLRGRENELNDLSSLDADLYRNLLFLKRYQGDVEALSLFFAVTEARLSLSLILSLTLSLSFSLSFSLSPALCSLLSPLIHPASIGTSLPLSLSDPASAYARVACTGGGAR